jgi:hypothetical protein
MTRHLDYNDTHSAAPSSYVPEFIEDNSTGKVTSCNTAMFDIYALPFGNRWVVLIGISNFELYFPPELSEIGILYSCSKFRY